MSDLMTFPDTVEEFMERYKVIDTEQVYTNGAELVPIFRMKQWFEHLPAAEPRKGKWIKDECGSVICSECKAYRRDSRINHIRFCNACGAKMEESDG